MNNLLALKFRKRQRSEWLCCLMVILPFTFGTFIDLLHGPSLIKYITDLIWIYLLLTMTVNRFRVYSQEAKGLQNCVVLLILISLVGYILNLHSILLYLWGFRNQYRFFLFFMACIMFLRKNSAENILELFDKVYYVNFVITLVQYVLFGLRQDYLGGIFGSSVGCNAKTIIFISIVLSRSVLGYLNRVEPLNRCAVKCVMALAIAALAELKFFFILFLLIIAMASLFTDFSVRKLLIILFSALGVFIAVQLLVTIFPMWAGWFNVESIMETALSKEGYTGRGDMNRLTSIPIAWNRFLNTFPEKLFGLGLGNCDTSSFAFLVSPFYLKYRRLRYNWFSGAFTMMELGLVGLVAYVALFILIFVYSKRRERARKCTIMDSQLARMLVIICLILNLYNASMRTEEAYLMYFVMAIPFLSEADKMHGMTKAGTSKEQRTV